MVILRFFATVLFRTGAAILALVALFFCVIMGLFSYLFKKDTDFFRYE